MLKYLFTIHHPHQILNPGWCVPSILWSRIFYINSRYTGHILCEQTTEQIPDSHPDNSASSILFILQGAVRPSLLKHTLSLCPCPSSAKGPPWLCAFCHAQISGSVPTFSFQLHILSSSTPSFSLLEEQVLHVCMPEVLFHLDVHLFIFSKSFNTTSLPYCGTEEQILELTSESCPCVCCERLYDLGQVTSNSLLK